MPIKRQQLLFHLRNEKRSHLGIPTSGVANMSARSMTPPQQQSTRNTHDPPATPRKGGGENDHDYLRRFVDPVLMPLIESLLLYQPESIYDFIHDYVDEEKAGRFKNGGSANGASVGYAKKLTHRRKMVDFMSTSVIPVMDDLAHQILREKPNSVTRFIKEIVAARIVVGSSGSMSDSNQQCEYVDYKVNDRVASRYKGRPRYYPGVIKAVDIVSDSFTVLYDDGKTEHNVHRMCLKPEESKRKTSRSSSNNNQVEEASSAGSLAGTSVQRTMEIMILIIGIDGAGKTTLLSTLQGDLEKEHVPSAGFTSAAFQTETGSATFYDLGGGPAFRNVWREYYSDAHGVMYVVDSSKESSLQEASTMLHDAMRHDNMANKPLLVFANKRDQPTALSEEKLFHQLDLAAFHNTKLVPCIAKPSANSSMVDDRLEHGLNWLFDQVHGNFDVLDTRVKEDSTVKKRQDEERRAAQRARVATWKEERERAQMTLHDKPSSQAVETKKKIETPEDADEIKCSNCTTAAAVTKCAASKWMPVCSECATSLKAAAAAAAGNH